MVIHGIEDGGVARKNGGDACLVAGHIMWGVKEGGWVTSSGPLQCSCVDMWGSGDNSDRGLT